MAQNLYGSNIKFGNTTFNATVVTDSAVLIWTQMGLTTDQIMYGLAMMNVESGYTPQITNRVKKDTIRGLGQFNAGTWSGTAKKYDASYNLNPYRPKNQTTISSYAK